MREIALMAVLVGVKESAAFFKKTEQEVQKILPMVVGDPFFANVRELILMSIAYSDIGTASKDF
jgi:hypothetical protein